MGHFFQITFIWLVWIINVKRNFVVTHNLDSLDMEDNVYTYFSGKIFKMDCHKGTKFKKSLRLYSVIIQLSCNCFYFISK